MKIEKLKIDKKRDVIVVEIINDGVVELGSKFYCGCCGGVLGESKANIKFPFSAKVFKDSLKKKTFSINRLGLHHKTCGHTMFSFSRGFSFVSLETYSQAVTQ